MTRLPAAPAVRVDQVDVLHGEAIPDPYRWLETTDAPETRAWVEAQNARTESWFAAVSERDALRERLTELWNFPRAGTPFGRGGRWFELRNTGLQDQDVLYLLEEPGGPGRVLLDPHALSDDGTVAVDHISVSPDGTLLAYATSVGGSDWLTWHVREVETGVDRADEVAWAKFSSASWRRDGGGFFYSAMAAPDAGAELIGASEAPQIRFHPIGADGAEDPVVFEVPEHPEWVFDAEATEDGRYLVITVAEGTAAETRLHVLDLEHPGSSPAELIPEPVAKFRYVDNDGTRFLLLTDHEAERGRLVAVDLQNPSPEAWEEVVAEAESLLLTARPCGGRLVLHRLEHACSRLAVHHRDGRHSHDVPLPAICSLTGDLDGVGFDGQADSAIVHFSTTSFTDSGTGWRHDLDTGATTVIRPPAAAIDPDALVSEQVFVTASDGASLPLFLTRRRDVTADGERPVLLYGYGGFDVPVGPAFRVSWTTWIERGGVLAVAVLRGGGEYGPAWHHAGTREHKQRVFDDFADHARWLVDSDWTVPGRIAVNGASNGGLLVGATLLQHPDLIGAAVADVGVMDMLRFHRFTIGWAWKSDYGDPEDPDDFRVLRAYSPLHNVRPGVAYPPTLLTTGDRDDRVVPGHSFKFAATLQANAGPDAAPVLLRTDVDAGHGHGMPTSKAIAKATDVLAFLTATVGG